MIMIIIIKNLIICGIIAIFLYGFVINYIVFFFIKLLLCNFFMNGKIKNFENKKFVKYDVVVETNVKLIINFIKKDIDNRSINKDIVYLYNIFKKFNYNNNFIDYFISASSKIVKKLIHDKNIINIFNDFINMLKCYKSINKRIDDIIYNYEIDDIKFVKYVNIIINIVNI